MSFILHCGGLPASIDQLGAVPLPPKTSTYTPVPFDTFANLVLAAVTDQGGMEVEATSWGLNNHGAQMFGLVQCKAPKGADTRMTFGLRSSHDFSMAVGLCGGKSVLVCDNLCFSGDDFTIMRKHTGSVLEELAQLVADTVASTVAGQALLEARFKAMKALEVPTERGYEILGVALGHALLTSKQATRSFSEWRKPTHEEFAPRSLWSLYNAGTSAMKLGPVRGTIGRHTHWDGFIRRGGVPAGETANPLGRELTALEAFYAEAAE